MVAGGVAPTATASLRNQVCVTVGAVFRTGGFTDVSNTRELSRIAATELPPGRKTRTVLTVGGGRVVTCVTVTLVVVWPNNATEKTRRESSVFISVLTWKSRCQLVRSWCRARFNSVVSL